MIITVIPASSQVCRSAIDSLLNNDDPHAVVGVYRDPKKAPSMFTSHPNFRAVQGDITEASSLDFTGTQALLVLTPPKYDGSDFVAFAEKVANNVRAAVQRAPTVRRLVYVSSVGAQFAEGVGEIKSNHVCEEILQTAADQVTFVRNAYYMENWSKAVETSLRDGVFASPITPMSHKIPMVSARDVGRACAVQLVASSVSGNGQPIVYNSWGPEEYSTKDVGEALSKLAQKDIRATGVPPEDLADFFGGFLPPAMVGEFVEMTRGLLPGGILDRDAKETTNVVRGKDTLLEAFRGIREKGS